MKKLHKILLVTAILGAALAGPLTVTLAAQEQKTPEQQEKEFREGIDREIETLTDVLKLDEGQVFYADSILTSNMYAMKAEIEAMSRARVENPDLYQMVQDKWMERSYEAFGKILRPEQWTKYLKTGAERDKKARDKRAAKRK